MILITGDIHGSHDIHKLSNKGNPDFKDIFNSMTKNDYVIICGDFGLVWNNDKEDMWWRSWLNDDLSPPSLLTAITRISTS